MVSTSATSGEHHCPPVFDAFVENVREVDTILHLSADGMLQLASGVKLAEALSVYERQEDPSIDQEDEERRLDRIRLRAKFAAEEIDRGFPVLFAHAVVALWGALEHLVFNLVVARLQDAPVLLTCDPFQSLKVSLAELRQIGEEEQIPFIVTEVSRRLKVDLQAGVNRFEALLTPVGLGGAVSETMRRDIFELFHLRNILVHRAGVADRRFLSQCPWRSEQSGEKVLVTPAEYSRFLATIDKYGAELAARVNARGAWQRRGRVNPTQDTT